MFIPHELCVPDRRPWGTEPHTQVTAGYERQASMSGKEAWHNTTSARAARLKIRHNTFSGRGIICSSLKSRPVGSWCLLARTAVVTAFYQSDPTLCTSGDRTAHVSVLSLSRPRHSRSATRPGITHCTRPVCISLRALCKPTFRKPISAARYHPSIHHTDIVGSKQCRYNKICLHQNVQQIYNPDRSLKLNLDWRV